MSKRNQGSTPTPHQFHYYRQGLHTPASVKGSHRRGKVLGRSEEESAEYAKTCEEINKKLQEHEAATFGKILVNEPLKKK